MSFWCLYRSWGGGESTFLVSLLAIVLAGLFCMMLCPHSLFESPRTFLWRLSSLFSGAHRGRFWTRLQDKQKAHLFRACLTNPPLHRQSYFDNSRSVCIRAQSLERFRGHTQMTALGGKRRLRARQDRYYRAILSRRTRTRKTDADERRLHKLLRLCHVL